MPEPQEERTVVTSKESKRTVSQDSHENLRSQDNIIKSTALESADLAGRNVLAALQGPWRLKHWTPALASVPWRRLQIFQQKTLFSFFFRSQNKREEKEQMTKRFLESTHGSAPASQAPRFGGESEGSRRPQWGGGQ